jgi:hypothetical protein
VTLPPTLARAEVERDLVAAAAWARRHGWALRGDPDALELRASTTIPRRNDSSRFERRWTSTQRCLPHGGSSCPAPTSPHRPPGRSQANSPGSLDRSFTRTRASARPGTDSPTRPTVGRIVSGSWRPGGRSAAARQRLITSRTCSTSSTCTCPRVLGSTRERAPPQSATYGASPRETRRHQRCRRAHNRSLRCRRRPRGAA